MVATDGDGRDNFGSSVALDGDTAVIGAWLDEDPNGDGAGSAYVFERGDDGWSQQAKLAAGDGDSGDRFGVSVALSGDTALIGAYQDEDPNGSDAGAAYVFTRNGTDWSQQAKLAPDDGDFGDLFGLRVAIDGDTALIGAPDDEDPNGEDAGSAYVFERGNDGWSQRAKLAPSDGVQNTTFGVGMALDGTTALIGNNRDIEPNGLYGGSAYIFENGQDGWSEQAKLAAEDGDQQDRFGEAVAIDGGTAVIGAGFDEDPNGSQAGSAYVFTDGTDGWSQQTKLTPEDGDSGDMFGRAVAVDGDTAVIGARWDEDPNGYRAGSAYVFTRGDDGWSQEAKLAAADGRDGDWFGEAVALSGTTTLIGANGVEGPNGDASGAAYAFQI